MSFLFLGLSHHVPATFVSQLLVCLEIFYVPTRVCHITHEENQSNSEPGRTGKATSFRLVFFWAQLLKLDSIGRNRYCAAILWSRLNTAVALQRPLPLTEKKRKCNSLQYRWLFFLSNQYPSTRMHQNYVIKMNRIERLYESHLG